MEHLLSSEWGDILLKLFIAMFLGMVIGVERIFAHKTAGMRTYALVSMGAALFVIVSQYITLQYIALSGTAPLYIPGQIVTGVGFLGAGLMIWQGSTLLGVTTAAGIWVSAGIGMAAGFGLYGVAFIATILTLFIFIVLWFIEQKIRHISDNESGDDLLPPKPNL